MRRFIGCYVFEGEYEVALTFCLSRHFNKTYSRWHLLVL